MTGLGYLWSLVWLVLAGGFIAAFGTSSARPNFRRYLPKLAAAVGFLSAVLLPLPFSLLGLLVFVVGLGYSMRRDRVNA